MPTGAPIHRPRTGAGATASADVNGTVRGAPLTGAMRTMPIRSLMIAPEPAPRPKRPLLRMFMATLKPLPTSPSTFSIGILTLSKKI